MNFKSTFARAIEDVIEKKYSVKAPTDISKLIEKPKNEDMGDLAFPAFIFAKPLKMSPPDTAAMLEKELQPQLAKLNCSKIHAQGPFLNFVLETSTLAKNLIPEIIGNKFTAAQKEHPLKVMIEFSQPNTHKEFHVGHGRNVCLGDSLVRLYRWAGYPVIAANYIGDVGTHIAKFMWAYSKTTEKPPAKNKSAYLGKLYATASKELDLATYSAVPFKDIIAAKVIEKKPHPENEKWNVLKLSTGYSENTVVCAGTDYNLNDVVAYAPVGIRFNKQRLEPRDMKGISSEGMVCGFGELKATSPNPKSIFVVNQAALTQLPEGTIYKEQELGSSVADFYVTAEGKDVDKVTALVDQKNKEVGEFLQKLEQDDPEATKTWRETRQWSLDEFDELYDWLDVKFDHFFYESDVEKSSKEVVKKAFDDGLLIESQGAIGADLTKYKLPFFMLLKSNGTGLYSTKDI
ncbi:arginine--tRNA ligase, partial [bacterium]|nr:arginine--tRNA ligase [bacterium]